MAETEAKLLPAYTAPDGAGRWPWQESKSWLWVSVAFGLLFLATIFLIAPKIQRQLDQQVRLRLLDAGIDPGQLDLDWDYRNLRVNGYLPDGVSMDEFATILRGTTELNSAFFAKGVRHLWLNVDDGTFFSGSTGFSTGPGDDTLSVEVAGDGTVTKLTGAVQNELQRSMLVEAVLEAGVENIFDQLDVLATPATEPVNERVSLLADMLREIGPMQTTRSEITMTENDLHYRITARDKQSALAIEKAASNEMTNFRITGGVDIFSNYSLDLKARTDGEKITLTGQVRSEAQRKRLVFAATEAVGDRNVIDQLTMHKSTSGSSQSMTQVESIAAVISRFAPGIEGDVSLKGDELVINADAGSEAVRQYLLSATASARSAGLNVTENIELQLTLDESEALQAELDQLINEVRATVVFSSGQSDLSEDAMQTLDKVADRIKSYTGLLIEIEGHTDDVGRANVNEQLSQTRANAVRAYLAQNSIDGNRLIAVGYGHRKPLEENDTAEGRQANRRVHFTVLKRPDSSDG